MCSRSRGEMDITRRFGRRILGSSPGESIKNFVRAARIELAIQSWQDRVLPLNHARVGHILAYSAEFINFCVSKCNQVITFTLKYVLQTCISHTPYVSLLVLCLP